MKHNDKQKLLFAIEKLYFENPQVKKAMDKLFKKVEEAVDYKLPGEKNDRHG